MPGGKSGFRLRENRGVVGRDECVQGGNSPPFGDRRIGKESPSGLESRGLFPTGRQQGDIDEKGPVVPA